MNLVEAGLERAGDGLACRLAGQVLAVPPELVRARPGLEGYVGKTIGLGIRPEQLEDAALAGDVPLESRLRGKVVTTELLGSELLAHVEIEAAPVVTQEVSGRSSRTSTARAWPTSSPRRRLAAPVVIGRFGIGSEARPGAEVEMRVDARRLHFFDLDSEAAIGRDGIPSGPDPLPTARLDG